MHSLTVPILHCSPCIKGSVPTRVGNYIGCSYYVYNSMIDAYIFDCYSMIFVSYFSLLSQLVVQPITSVCIANKLAFALRLFELLSWLSLIVIVYLASI